MTNFKDDLINYTKVFNVFIKLANGSRIPVEGIGDRGLLKGVLYVSTLKHNLVSVSKLTAEGFSVVFTNDLVEITHPCLKCPVEIGRLTNKLYISRSEFAFTGDETEQENDVEVRPDVKETNKTSIFTSHKWCPQNFKEDRDEFMNDDVDELGEFGTKHQHLTIDLLHKRFGHADVNKIKQLLRRGAVDGLDITYDKLRPTHFCEHCVIAKSTKHTMHKKFSTNSMRKTVKQVQKDLFFEIVTTDLIGPIQVESIDHKRYGITFTEVNSRYRWFYALRRKSDALDAFKQFYAEITSKGFTIRSLKSDNGGEYISTDFKTFCTSKHIVQRFTQPHTPQSNSYSERFNRILGERTRAMLSGSNLPNFLWAEAMQTTTYLYNRMIGPGSITQTPFELLFGFKPNISNLRAYGCLAFAYNFDVNRQKLDPKAFKGILVGYDISSAAYRIYLPTQRVIIKSGHVIFNEHKLYFDTVSSDAPLDFDTVFENTMPSSQTTASLVTSNQSSAEVATPNESINSPAMEFAAEPRPIRIRKPVEKMDLSFIAMENESTGNEKVRFMSDEHAFSVEEMLSYEIDELIDILESNDANVPFDYDDAVRAADAFKWNYAIRSERSSILKHDTFEYVNISDVPEHKTLLKSRWIFKIKRDGKYKARFVVKGFSQKFGIDYRDVYAPVMNKTSLRLLLSIAAAQNWEIHQMDVKTAFLHGELSDELYLAAPKGFDVPEGKVIRLKKSLYGLKQAPRNWYNTLSEFLISNGFKKNTIDKGVFKFTHEDKIIIIGVYVDDLLIMGNSLSLILDFKMKISSRFEMEDLGEVDKILGMQIIRDRNLHTLQLVQLQYISKLLEKFKIEQASIARRVVPLSKATVNATFDPELKISARLQANAPYRQAIGSILYLSVCSRPDIAYAISTLASFCSEPKLCHWKAVKELLNYISTTQSLGITYGKIHNTADVNKISIYADADYASAHNKRRSRGGYIIFMNGGPIAWHSALQSKISLCTSESELYALVDACKEGIYLKHFLDDLGFPQDKVMCYEDNKGCLDWLNNNKGNSRMKQLETKAYWLQELVGEEIFEVIHIESRLQKADFLTKAMDLGIFFEQLDLSLS